MRYEILQADIIIDQNIQEIKRRKKEKIQKKMNKESKK